MNSQSGGSLIRTGGARLAITVVILALSTTVFAQSAELPEIHVGDRWAWQHTNGLAREIDRIQIEDVLDVSTSEIQVRVRVKGAPSSFVQTFNVHWNPVDIGDARYSPYLKEFDFPLFVGKKWKAEADKLQFSNGSHAKFSIRGQVVAEEPIVVPAGTFETYKIVLDVDAVGKENTNDVGTLGDTATSDDSPSGHTVETIWYAPSAKRYVKLENAFSQFGRIRRDDIYELLEFSLR